MERRYGRQAKGETMYWELFEKTWGPLNQQQQATVPTTELQYLDIVQQETASIFLHLHHGSHG